MKKIQQRITIHHLSLREHTLMSFLPPSRRPSGYVGRPFEIWILGDTPPNKPFVAEARTIALAVKHAVKSSSSPGEQFDKIVLASYKTQNGNRIEKIYQVTRYPKDTTFKPRSGRDVPKIMGWRIVRLYDSPKLARIPESDFPASSKFRSPESRVSTMADEEGGFVESDQERLQEAMDEVAQEKKEEEQQMAKEEDV